MTQFKITENDAAQRLDKFLQKAAPNLPPTVLYKALRTKHIKVNRKRAEGSYRLQASDVVDCWLADEFFTQPSWQHDFLCADTALEVLYEDAHVLVADKPAALLSHPGECEYIDTLLGRVQRYLYEKDEYVPEQESSFAPALVNRIDRNTQGIVIAAKTAVALRELNERMKRRELRKFYLCAVHGTPPGDHRWQHLRSWMQKDADKSFVRVYDSPGPGRKECLTNYRVLHRQGEYSLLEVELLTGRTHQIRAQFAHIGYALVGDGKYAPRAQYHASPVKWQCLCAWRLIFSFNAALGELDYLDKLDISVSKTGFLREIFPSFTSMRENIWK